MYTSTTNYNLEPSMKFRPLLIVLLMQLLPSSMFAQGTWESVGPYGGWINDLKEDNTGRLLAATSFGGIFRSADNAESWEQIYNDTLIFDPRSIATNSSGHIFVGSEGIFGPGFLRSTDDGATWQVLNTGLQGVTALLVSNTQEIFACTFDGGLFRSPDNGSTFNLVSGLPALYTTDIETNSSGDLFVGVQFDAVDLYRSTDNGVTWQPADNGIGSDVVDVSAAGTGDLYATDALAVYKSTNNGDNWTNLMAPSSGGFYGVAGPSTSNVYAAAWNGIFRTTDNGTTWTQETGLPARGVGRLLIAQSGMLFAGGFGQGVYRRMSTTGSSGSDWEQKVNGMTNTFITGIAQDATSGYLYASTRHALVFRSTDLGVSWEQKSSGLVESDWINDIAVNTDGTIFTVSASGPPLGGGISRSTDQGISWTNIYPVAATAIACNTQGHVFAGLGSRVYRSTDNGGSWTSAILSSVQNIADIAFEGENIVYAATSGQGVFVSMDNGDSWMAINNGLGDLDVTTIFTADSSASRGTGSFWGAKEIVGTGGAGLYGYNPMTGQWEEIGLQSFQIVASVRLTDRPLAYVAALIETITNIISIDQTRTLQFIGTTRREIKTLGTAVSGSASLVPTIYLLLGSNGYGILRDIVITDVSEPYEVPVSSSLFQNYPNPFNPLTTLSFTIHQSSLVNLSVYDLLGREVAELVNEEKGPGIYEVRWDATGQASGVYFYRLSTTDFVQTKKLVLLR